MPNLQLLISSIFCVIVVISNLLSGKLITLPILGGFVIPFGILTYPLTFLISDLVTEIFGAQKAKAMVYTGMACSLLGLGIVQLALMLPPAEPEVQTAFQAVFGINKIVVIGSLIAYMTGQILDIKIYALIKRWTGGRFLWLRNNGSTLISQIADTLIVNMIHLYWGLGMDFEAVVQIMLFSYCYKALISVANTPLFYLCVFLARGEWRTRVPAVA